MWAVFLLARAFDVVYNYLKMKKIIPRFSYDWILIMGLEWMLPGYAYAMEPGCMPKSLHKFTVMMCNEDIGDMSIRTAWI